MFILMKGWSFPKTYRDFPELPTSFLNYFWYCPFSLKTPPPYAYPIHFIVICSETENVALGQGWQILLNDRTCAAPVMWILWLLTNYARVGAVVMGHDTHGYNRGQSKYPYHACAIPTICFSSIPPPHDALSFYES